MATATSTRLHVTSGFRFCVPVPDTKNVFLRSVPSSTCTEWSSAWRADGQRSCAEAKVQIFDTPGWPLSVAS
eukprot:2398748-Prymnesium_polylepis.2